MKAILNKGNWPFCWERHHFCHCLQGSSFPYSFFTPSLAFIMFYNYNNFFCSFFSCVLTLQLAFTLWIGFDITYSSLTFLLSWILLFHSLLLWSFFPFLELWSYLFLFLHSTATSSLFWRLCFSHHRSKPFLFFGAFFVFCLQLVSSRFYLFLFLQFIFVKLQIWTTTFYEQLFKVASLFSTTFNLVWACKVL